MPSFYVVGGTLRRDAPSYVEREADRRLYIALQQKDVCYILTPRQMGKSSLMVRTAARLREDGVAVAVVDLTGLGQNLTTEQWYNGLIDRVEQQLRLEDMIEDVSRQWERFSPLERWMRTLREIVLPNCSGNVVIFIDEIDAVRSLPFSTDEFFAGIRELYNRRTEDPALQRLTFCLMGVATPSDLIRDTRTTPFNIGRRIELTDFTEEEAAPLAQGLGRGDRTGQQLLRRVLYWTGGHPYLTQRLCQAVAEDTQVCDSKAVDQVCSDLFLSRRARERDDNLLFVRERILRSEVETAALLSLYSKIRANKRVQDDDTNPLVPVLRLSGITRVNKGLIRVRNRVYYQVFDEAWITSNLPGAELRRQRAAYRQGLKLAAAIFLPLAAIGFAIFGGIFYERQMHLDKWFRPPGPPAFWLSGSMRGAEQAQVGALLVTTGDENVTVFINDQQYGRTTKRGELRIPQLAPELYRIRVEKPGFQSVTQQAKIIQNSETQLVFKLQRQVVTVQIAIQNALPGTSVRLDGDYVGTSSDNGSFLTSAPPGEHTVELTRDGYLAKKITEHLRLGTLLAVDGRLTPDPEFQAWTDLANSQDPGGFQAFLKEYPQSRFAEKARSRAEQLEWDAIKDKDDLQALNALDTFQKRYPRGQFAKAAKDRITQLQTEQMAWMDASTSKDPAALDAFLAKYPGGPYALPAREEIVRRKDRQAILQLLQQYEKAYGRQDVNALADLWPSMPPSFRRVTQSKFNEAQSISLVLRVDDGEPEIEGSKATVTGKELLKCTRKDQSASTVEYPFAFQLAKEGERWIILKKR